MGSYYSVNEFTKYRTERWWSGKFGRGNVLKAVGVRAQLFVPLDLLSGYSDCGGAGIPGHGFV